MKRVVLLLAGIVALCAGAVSADEVVFKNGDKLSGTITALAGGKLTIHTLEGDVVVALSEVETFSTDAPIKVVLSDGTELTRKIDADSNGQVLLPGGILGPEHVNVSDIGELNPPPVAWTGDIKFGGLLTRGNTDTESVDFGFDLTRKSDQDLANVNAEYLTGRTKTNGVETTTADQWNAESRYDYNFTKVLYGFADLQFSHDRLAFLDLRFNPSAGLGYHLINRPNFTLDPEGGLAWVYEEYTNGTPTRRDISLKLAYHLNWQCNQGNSIFNDVEYFPSIQYGKNFLVNVDAGIHSAISKSFFMEFKVVWNYDSTPANGALKNNTRYELNLGYKF